jgi:hypothetical protein
LQPSSEDVRWLITDCPFAAEHKHLLEQ